MRFQMAEEAFLLFLTSAPKAYRHICHCIEYTHLLKREIFTHEVQELKAGEKQSVFSTINLNSRSGIQNH